MELSRHFQIFSHAIGHPQFVKTELDDSFSCFFLLCINVAQTKADGYFHVEEMHISIVVIIGLLLLFFLLLHKEATPNNRCFVFFLRVKEC